jgi:hypothetical protein
MTEKPEWNVAIVDGQPETVINAAALRELIKLSPYGVEEAKRRLIERGVPPEMLVEEPA